MFCGKCGTQIPDIAAFCPKCGARTEGQPAGAQTHQPQAQQAQVCQPSMGQPTQPVRQSLSSNQNTQHVYAGMQMGANPEYRTLGGWLLLLVILEVLAVLYLLNSLIQGNTEWGNVSPYYAWAGYGSYNTFMMLASVLFLALAASLAVFVFLIISRHDGALKLYQVTKITILVFSILLAINAATLPPIAYKIPDAFVIYFVFQAIGTGISMLLLTLYFCKSVRVRTYMGSTSYLDKALFKIGA